MASDIEIPESLQELAQRNHAFLTPILAEAGTNFDQLGARNPQLVERVGEIVMREILGPQRLGRFLLKRAGTVLQTTSPEYFSDRKDIVQRLKLAESIQKVGLVWFIMRPDTYHLYEQAIELMDNNRYQFVGVMETQVNGAQYWDLCRPAILEPNAHRIMPTRTTVYTNGECRAMFFFDLDPRRIFSNYEHYENRLPATLKGDKFACAQDIFFDNFKGVQAQRGPNTLRGDLVLEEALRLGYHELINPTVAMALDPFAGYRTALQDKTWITAPHLKSGLVHPMLQYTGVGIHVPNGQEYIPDLVSLFDFAQLSRIENMAFVP